MTAATPDAVVRRYLAELGVDSPTVDADGLLALHEAHVHRFAHDTIWISRGRIPPLDGRAFAEALSSGEGGGCLQLTGGFAWLLDALGFDVTLHRARVQRAFDPEPVGPPNAHVTMIVAVDGRRSYADPGLGSALESPVPLEDADIAQGKISVLTPVGAALIGLRTGPSISWRTRDDRRRAGAGDL